MCQNDDNNQMRWIKHKKFKLKMPLSRFAFIWLQSIEVVVVFGGETNGRNFSDNIFILDLNAKKCEEIKGVKCPFRGLMDAVLSPHSNGKEMIHLFIRHKHYAMDLMTILPSKYGVLTSISPSVFNL